VGNPHIFPFIQQVAKTISNQFSKLPAAFLIAGVVTGGSARADDSLSGWLQSRDSNPFALATGLPLPPSVPRAGTWQFNTTLSIANTELQQFAHGSSLLFDAETHESRFSAAYAFNPRWSVGASISHLWIGGGFLDHSIESFHRAFGFDNGDRGQLGSRAPEIEIQRNGEILYALDRSRSGAGPLLLDLTRNWRVNDDGIAGVSASAKLPTGSRTRLSDSGGTDVSFAAFALLPLGDHFTIGVRGGVLLQNDNRLLGNSARNTVPFASALLRYRLGQKWSAVVQSDAHGALYRDLPAFLSGVANQLGFGLARRIGENGELQLTLAEDLPALHTTDVAINLNLRLNLGR
jgi:hypothetical protein